MEALTRLVVRVASPMATRVYTAEGCAYCHTQMVRPSDQLGTDLWRDEWNGRGPNWEGDEGKPAPIRTLRPEDYLEETIAHLGIQRTGPDLSNFGWRNLSNHEIHQSLYSPRSVKGRSNMPGLQAPLPRPKKGFWWSRFESSLFGG